MSFAPHKLPMTATSRGRSTTTSATTATTSASCSTLRAVDRAVKNNVDLDQVHSQLTAMHRQERELFVDIPDNCKKNNRGGKKQQSVVNVVAVASPTRIHDECYATPPRPRRRGVTEAGGIARATPPLHVRNNFYRGGNNKNNHCSPSRKQQKQQEQSSSEKPRYCPHTGRRLAPASATASDGTGSGESLLFPVPTARSAVMRMALISGTTTTTTTAAPGSVNKKKIRTAAAHEQPPVVDYHAAANFTPERTSRMPSPEMKSPKQELPANMDANDDAQQSKKAEQYGGNDLLFLGVVSPPSAIKQRPAFRFVSSFRPMQAEETEDDEQVLPERAASLRVRTRSCSPPPACAF